MWGGTGPPLNTRDEKDVDADGRIKQVESHSSPARSQPAWRLDLRLRQPVWYNARQLEASEDREARAQGEGANQNQDKFCK
jgi:hypothetical protein